MASILDIVLLLALPASGKSEVRKYLDQLTPEQALRDFHMGPTLQLDDYPYVHLMRRISEELRHHGHDGVFFASDIEPFLEPRDWGTLIELVNEDFDDLQALRQIAAPSAGDWLLKRYDAARRKVGAPPAFERLDAKLRARLVARLEPEAKQLLADKLAGYPSTREGLKGRTIVIEFARGGPDGASMPLPAPLGYQYSLGRLSDAILSRASILYIWVTPEESRRKNDERAKPGREGDASILHHGVPIKVMLGDYGCDDIEHLMQTSDRPGTVRVDPRGKAFYLPIARFDNRVDKTSFIREDHASWKPEQIQAVHSGLQGALTQLAKAHRG